MPVPGTIEEMKGYRCRQGVVGGKDYAEIVRKARHIYHDIARQTKREPFIRSAYFDKDKVFLNSFWTHLNTKRQNDRKRRLRFYACALELIQNTRIKPEIVHETMSELIYRFSGLTASEESFIVQIRQETKNGRKYFTSVFPFE